MSRRKWRRLAVSAAVTLLCLYLPFVLPALWEAAHGREALHGGLRWLPVLPGAYLASFLRDESARLLFAAALSLLLLCLLISLGSRNWRLQLLCALIALAFCSLNAYLLHALQQRT